jgi:Predicted metal-dependent protease of the PAD1/JAB1 superfamily
MSWHKYQVHSFDYVLKGIMDECKKSLPNETIGFLVGIFCKWRNEYYTLVDGYMPVEGSSSEYHVVMDVESIASSLKMLEEEYDDKHSIVGWYHSHPGYGVFLSAIDIKSHMTFFNHPLHVALVVDPIKKRYGFFKLSKNNESIPISYAIWKRKMADER